MPESLNILSYCMAWVIAFQGGAFFGMWLQRRMIRGVIATGREQVESLLGNVSGMLKKGVKENAQTNHVNQPAGHWDSGLIVASGWQEKSCYGETVTGTVTGNGEQTGLADGAREDHCRRSAGAGAQGGQSVSGEARSEEEGASAGAA